MRRALLRCGLTVFLGAGLGAMPGFAEGDVKAQQGEVRERISEEKAALELLRTQKTDALEVLEWLEGLTRTSVARAELQELQVKQLRRRIERTEAQERQARAALEAQLKLLGPRLRVMDRTSRRSRLDVLLSSSDFSALMWRSRAMSTLVKRDLELLERVQRIARYQARSLAKLDSLKVLLHVRLERAAVEGERARRQKLVLADVLEFLQAEQSQSNRLVRELEHAERKLAAMVEELEIGPPTSGFGALKGALPMPTQGLVEARFGRVVNPKFNTVVLQKGLDIRAPVGTPVKAIADGKVVYAGAMRGYGNLLILEHGQGYHSLMAHLEGFSRSVGDEVKAGDEVAKVGETGSLKGAYLYFELRQRGEAIDPSPWLVAR